MLPLPSVFGIQTPGLKPIGGGGGRGEYGSILMTWNYKLGFYDIHTHTHT